MEHLDPDFVALAAAAAVLAPQYTAGAVDPWEGSPFQWMMRVPPRSKGAIGEALFSLWCEGEGFEVRRSPSLEADRIVNGHRIEVKLSTLWKNGGFWFQQIRDQDYDYCLCLAISPFDVNAWLLPKPVLSRFVIGQMGQHTGKGASDTDKLSFRAGDPYPWMAPYGDRLDDVARLIQANGRGPY